MALMLSSEVVNVVVPACVALATSAGAFLVQHLQRRAQERRLTQIRYLYPLKVACDDLLQRLDGITAQIQQQPGTVNGPFVEAKELATKDGFYGHCNGKLCGPVGTMYATAVHFAYATKLRDDLLLLRLSHKKVLALLRATEAVRAGLAMGGGYGFWSEMQDSIGRLLLEDDGRVMPYSAFCRSLGEDPSYTRLFDFYAQIEEKKNDQLRAGTAALRRLQALLNGVLRIATDAPTPEAT